MENNSYDEIGYEEELICLKGEISQKNIEICCLQSSLNTAKENIKQLTTALLESTSDAVAHNKTQKKQRNISDDAKKRYEFYNKHKNDPEILDPLKEKFGAIGIKHIPWYCIKDLTDEQYYISTTHPPPV